jgi:hypothetical protein
VRPLLLALIFIGSTARAELLILTRDGVLHHGPDGPAAPLGVDKPRAMAVLTQEPLALAVAHARGLLEVAGKTRAVPGQKDDLVQVAACDGAPCGLTGGAEVVRIEASSGRRTPVAKWPHPGLLLSDGNVLLGVHDGAVEEVGASSRSWKLDGHAIAGAACDGRVFVATHEGPLWQLDRASGRKRDLGLGGWWGTLALACRGTHLYAATQSGKLWDIDFAAGTKRALAMDGWQSTVALAVTAEGR